MSDAIRRCISYSPGNQLRANATKQLDALLARIDELENKLAQGIHSCSDACTRPMCVLRRERDKLSDDVDELRGVLSSLALYVSAGMGDESTTAADYEERIRWGIDHVVGVERKVLQYRTEFTVAGSSVEHKVNWVPPAGGEGCAG